MKKQHVSIRNVTAESGVEIIEPCNLYGCELKKDVFVGPFCEIQSDVSIGAKTRIQSHTFICSLVVIGEDCFVGHGVVFINDKFTSKRETAGDKSHWQNTIIGDRVLIGSNVTVLPVQICSDVVIGAGSVVTSDIVEPGTYVGNPARKLT